MASIDKNLLDKAMSTAPITRKQLAEKVDISLTYMCDIADGRRTLKRNPDLRRRLAEAIGVPQFWIEHHDAEQPV